MFAHIENKTIKDPAHQGRGWALQFILIIGVATSVGLSAKRCFGQKVYWTDQPFGGVAKIKRANIDGSSVEQLLSTRIPQGIAVDAAAGKVYWSDRGTQSVQRANLDGSNEEELVLTNGPWGLALDLEHGQMYWSTWSPNRGIYRADLDGQDVEQLIATGGMPQGIALDLPSGKIYWMESGWESVFRADLSGANKETLIQGAPFTVPFDVALDAENDTMYITDGLRIWRANLDGADLRVVHSIAGGYTTGIDFDKANGRIYWGNADKRSIQRVSVNGGVEETVFSRTIGQPADVAIASDGRLYWTTTVPAKDGIQSVTLNGAEVYTVPLLSIRSPAGIALDLANGKIYWADAFSLWEIHRANLDGSEHERVYFGTGGANSIALDVVRHRVYWGDLHYDRIGWARFDGSGAEAIVTASVTNPRGLALDSRRQELCWFNDSARLRCSRLDGSEVRDVATVAQHPGGLAIDPQSELLFWTNAATNNIFSACRDGSNVQALAIAGIVDPTGVAVSPNTLRLCWVQQFAPSIQCADYDGANVTVFAPNPAAYPFGIAIDPCGRRAGAVGKMDLGSLVDCLQGPGSQTNEACICSDLDVDGWVALDDFAALQNAVHP